MFGRARAGVARRGGREGGRRLPLLFARGGSGPGEAGDPAWTAACVGRATRVVPGHAGAPYEPGLLALRGRALLEAAVRARPELPDVLLVDATGRDHPRRAGLALQLGAVLGLPTVGIPHRPLLAEGGCGQTSAARGVRSGSTASSSATGCGRGWVRARWPSTRLGGQIGGGCGRRPLGCACPHAEPLRTARRRAREARAVDNGENGREGR